MAFSTAQEQYIKSLVSSNLEKYPEGYYIAWNTPTSDSNKYDLHIIFSDTHIFSQSSTFSNFVSGTNLLLAFRGNCIQYDIITSNPSGYNADFSPRIVIHQNFNADDPTKFDLTFDLSNTISTNADFDNEGVPHLVGDILSSTSAYIYSDIHSYDYFKSDIVFSIFLIVVVLFVNFRSHFKFKFRK